MYTPTRCAVSEADTITQFTPSPPSPHLEPLRAAGNCRRPIYRDNCCRRRSGSLSGHRPMSHVALRSMRTGRVNSSCGCREHTARQRTPRSTLRVSASKPRKRTRHESACHASARNPAHATSGTGQTKAGFASQRARYAMRGRLEADGDHHSETSSFSAEVIRLPCCILAVSGGPAPSFCEARAAHATSQTRQSRL